jgi:hypothetical protein
MFAIVVHQIQTANQPVVPTAPGDSSGVRPNIAFQINDVDYYTTGDMVYQGLGGTNSGSDTLNNWRRFAFVYKTKPGQTSFTLTLRNNAPGGGGNDWALDDIGIRTCYPSMKYSPSATPSVCAGRTLFLTDTVRSYYDGYAHYKWQRYTVASGVWADIAGTTTTTTPVWNGSRYEFVATYTLGPTFTTLGNAGDQYRLVVATSLANLGNGCNYSDVVPITISINNCLDIDDDNDGIPDYVETNNLVALQDANSNGVPNWNDASYGGRVDNNIDGVDDRFDAGADADNDTRPNYLDTDFTFDGPFLDANTDGVNDRYDRDLDGIINQYDLDSDNDGVPDVVESYGADSNGDAIIDGYTDADNDGFASNLDVSAGGVAASGVGLGAVDLDGDGVPNYMDLDSDNDGIPDVVESAGNYVPNDGKISGFADVNKDGIADNLDLSPILRTGVAIDLNTNGRALDFPYKNLDRDLRPNAYDADADGDGIPDVTESGLTDANTDGIADGTLGIDGWSDTVDGLASLGLRNSDGAGNDNYLDIDADDDGIPDNIEGLSTASYQLPTTTDADGDGLMAPYDNTASFSGSGIIPYDWDTDLSPDYVDLDTDGDGALDVCEGNDWNFNNSCDEPKTLLGVDTDGDGLDNRFDSLNSVTNIKGTSYKMGNFGNYTGDATPGTKATVQKLTIGQIDRDWRFVGVVLPIQFLNFTANLFQNTTTLNWSLIAEQPLDKFEIERSVDNITFVKIGELSADVTLNSIKSFVTTDDIKGLESTIFYYRINVIGKTGLTRKSKTILVKKGDVKADIIVNPTVANAYTNVRIKADAVGFATLRLVDNYGKILHQQKVTINKGDNYVTLDNLDKFQSGVYSILVNLENKLLSEKLIISR